MVSIVCPSSQYHLEFPNGIKKLCFQEDFVAILSYAMESDMEGYEGRSCAESGILLGMGL